jgi:hypothetical protein
MTTQPPSNSALARRGARLADEVAGTLREVQQARWTSPEPLESFDTAINALRSVSWYLGQAVKAAGDTPYSPFTPAWAMRSGVSAGSCLATLITALAVAGPGLGALLTGSSIAAAVQLVVWMLIGHVQQRRELRRLLADRRERDHLAALDRLIAATDPNQHAALKHLRDARFWLLQVPPTGADSDPT